MLSDVTLQFHISYFCQDNDGWRHCQGMIADNSRHLGEPEEIYGKVLVVWGRWESVKSAPFLCIVTFQVTVNFTSVLLGIGDIYTSWQIVCCKSIYWSRPPFYSWPAHKHIPFSQTPKYLPTENLCDTHLCGAPEFQTKIYHNVVLRVLVVSF